MNTPTPSIRTAALARRIAAFLVVLDAVGYAQDTPSPAPAPAPAAPAELAQTEMQKWIATTDEQWQAILKRDVTDVHLTELEKLKQQYVAALEAAVTKGSAAGDLDGVVVLRNEEKRFAGTNLFPEQDEATDAATVKQIRAAVRAQIAKLEKDTAARTKALHAKYDAVLADAQSRLTKAQRIEDALLVKAKREEVAKAWITPVVGNSSQTTPPATIGQKTPASPTRSATPISVPTVSGAGGAKPDSLQSRSVNSNLKERLVNTVWIWSGQETITFLPGGKAKWSGGNAPLLTWRVRDNNNRVIEGTAVSGKPYRMTLDATLESGRLVIGDQAERATSRVTPK